MGTNRILLTYSRILAACWSDSCQLLLQSTRALQVPYPSGKVWFDAYSGSLCELRYLSVSHIQDALNLPLPELARVSPSLALTSVNNSLVSAYKSSPTLTHCSSLYTHTTSSSSRDNMAPRKPQTAATPVTLSTPAGVTKTKAKQTGGTTTKATRATEPAGTYRVKRYRNSILNLEKTPAHLVAM